MDSVDPLLFEEQPGCFMFYFEGASGEVLGAAGKEIEEILLRHQGEKTAVTGKMLEVGRIEGEVTEDAAS